MNIPKLIRVYLVVAILGLVALNAEAWDHPGHMTTAAIAFAEIEKERPELIEKIGLLMMKHPDPAPFWVASVNARGNERARRMFIEAARWPDDAKTTGHDRPTWHMSRHAVIADDAPASAIELVESREGRPLGNAIESLVLNEGVLSNPESSLDERALALCWLMHSLGDIHQPLHVGDLVSSEFPTGNAAGALAYVWDPLHDSAMPLHILWDSNTRRSTKLEDIDEYAREIMEKFPRSSFPELKPYEGPGDFNKWAKESFAIAEDWAYDIEVLPDPDLAADPDVILMKVVKYVLHGVSPVDEAPAVPDEYWDKVQEVVPRRMALAGYRIADIILNAAFRLETERNLTGEVFDAMPRHGPTN